MSKRIGVEVLVVARDKIRAKPFTLQTQLLKQMEIGYQTSRPASEILSK